MPLGLCLTDFFISMCAYPEFYFTTQAMEDEITVDDTDEEHAISIYNDKGEFIAYIFSCSATTDTDFFMITGTLREDCSDYYLERDNNDCMIDLRMIQKYVDNYIIVNQLF